jgi:hypothetical protein
MMSSYVSRSENNIVIVLMVTLLVICGDTFAADMSPKVEAVKQYLLKEEYSEVFNDTHYRMKVENIIEADLDEDGEAEVIFHVKPHYRQSPTIIIFKVSKDLRVSRVIEGLAPGPLIPVTGDYIDSHTLGDAMDLTIGEDQINPEKRKEVVESALENMGGVVEYRNFFHVDGREGKGLYIDMTSLPQSPDKDNCEDFEFSMPEAIAVKAKNDGSGNYLLARVGKEIYAYKIHKIRKDGLLEKSLTVTSD